MSKGGAAEPNITSFGSIPAKLKLLRGAARVIPGKSALGVTVNNAGASLPYLKASLSFGQMVC